MLQHLRTNLRVGLLFCTHVHCGRSYGSMRPTSQCSGYAAIPRRGAAHVEHLDYMMQGTACRAELRAWHGVSEAGLVRVTSGKEHVRSATTSDVPSRHAPCLMPRVGVAYRHVAYRMGVNSQPSLRDRLREQSHIDLLSTQRNKEI
jgi:hypothetical protein